jgi:hypothetical protein
MLSFNKKDDSKMFKTSRGLCPRASDEFWHAAIIPRFLRSLPPSDIITRQHGVA